MDVLYFSTSTMKYKVVSVFGISEVNCNFGPASMLESFHSPIQGTSSHHKDQLGGTCVSVMN